MANLRNNVLETIGRTPLVRLVRVTAGLRSTIYGKFEAQNPGGSFKDRIGLEMVEQAERDGRLRPGGTIIEATAGNTGVGLAQAAVVKGYRSVFVLPDKMSADKIALLRAYGAEVIVTRTVGRDDPDNYHNVAERLAREIPGAWFADQFGNPANPRAHYRTTGPEIWEDTDGALDAFVAGMGTTGSISGIGRFLKEQKPGIVIVGADPEGSVYSGGPPGSYKVEGIGGDAFPEICDRAVIDTMFRVPDRESFHMARRLAREEGLLVGGSSGSAVVAALRYAARLSEPQFIVVLLCDTGRNYISKLFSDRWMHENGFFEDAARAGDTVGDVLPAKAGIPPLVAVAPDATVSAALDLMQRYNISQVPVLEGGRAVGSLEETALMTVIHDGVDPGKQPVSAVMGRGLPEVPDAEDVAELYRMLLAGTGAVLVLHDGAPRAVLTRIDMINFYARRRNEVRDEGDPRGPGA